MLVIGSNRKSMDDYGRVNFDDSWWYYEPGFEAADGLMGVTRLWGFFHRCKYPEANVGVLLRKRVPFVDKTIYMCERCEAEPPKQVRAVAMLKLIGEKV